jgi:hypothetical protein
VNSPHTYEFFTPAGGLGAHVHRDVDDLVTPRPTVLVTGSWLTVKEQMPDRYASELAARGFTAVTFDFSGFGASSGVPGQAELPARKIAEIEAVAQALTTLSFVRGGVVGHLAVCASAQYTLRALALGAPIAAFASVAGWFHDTATVAPFYGGDDGVQMRLERGTQALEEYQTTGQVRTVPAYREGDDLAGMFFPAAALLRLVRPRGRPVVAQRDGRAQLVVLAHLRRAEGRRGGAHALRVRTQRRLRAARQCPIRCVPHAGSRPGVELWRADRLLRPGAAGAVRCRRSGGALPRAPASPVTGHRRGEAGMHPHHWQTGDIAVLTAA